MRIQEVEQQVGISKKNIRFYEQEGLLHPSRNEINKYREYSEEDVNTLKKIKFLRKLSVPISEIRDIQERHFSLQDGLRRHMVLLEREKNSTEKKLEICSNLVAAEETFFSLDAESCLQQMDFLEKGGVFFMDTKEADKRARKKTAILSALALVFLMVCLIGLFAWCTWGIEENPMPLILFIIFAAIPLVVIIGVLVSLKERLKEIERGEIYEASKY